MQLKFQTYGSGPSLVILHGLFGMLDNWHSVATKLGERFRVFVVDQRNHGRSPHSTEFNYAVMADDVRDFLEQRGVRSAFLLGHSMGGKTAMWVALRYPELIDKLVVIDIAPRRYSSLHDTILDALTSLDLARYSSRPEIDKALSATIPQQPVRQFLMKNLARNENGSFRWKMNLPVIESHYSEILEAVEADKPFPKPVMFIRSTQSTYIGVGDKTEIKRLFPNAVVADFNTGHWVHAEAPDALTKTVTAFLLI